MRGRVKIVGEENVWCGSLGVLKNEVCKLMGVMVGSFIKGKRWDEMRNERLRECWVGGFGVDG